MELNFWCPDVAAAAAACKAARPDAAALSIAIADDVCENRFLFRDHWEMERTHVPVTFDGPIDWAHIPAGDPEWLYAMNRHTSFVNLGKAWRYTGDEKYLRAYERLLADWIARVPLTEESKGNTWRSLEAGLRCEYWLRALRLFEGAADPALVQKAEACLLVHGEYLCKASDAFHLLSNWGVLQDHGLFLLGLAFDREDWRRLALERIDGNLHRAVFRDGSHWEQSPMYHCEVLHCAMDTVLAARQCGVEVPPRLVENVRRMCAALAAWITPDGRLVCQSDSDDTDARDLLAAGALLFGDEKLKAAAGSLLFEENFWDFGPVQAAYDGIRADPAALGSAALPDSGNYMLRGENGAYLHLHCGCLGSGHGHADLLHLDAGVAGEDVLIDSGRYTYVDSPIRRQLKLPAAHNTTRVDGADFSECVDSWGYSALAIPVKGDYTFTEQADFISGMHLGYLARGVVVGRKVVFLKRAGLAVVFDQFYTAGSHTYEQYFHFGPGECRLEGDTVFWRGSRAKAALLCLGEGLCLSLGKAPYSRDYNQLCQGDVLTARKQGEGFAGFLSVLSLDGDGEAQPVRAQVLPVAKLRLKTPLTDGEAQAVRVEKGGAAYTVIACHGEVISEVDLLAAGGAAGYGKLLVFGPEMEDGLCLAY